MAGIKNENSTLSVPRPLHSPIMVQGHHNQALQAFTTIQATVWQGDQPKLFFYQKVFQLDLRCQRHQRK